MGDSKTLAKARIELEELYLGIPDESVNLTFQDLAQIQNKAINKSPEKLTKLPSLDFNRALHQSNNHHMMTQDDHLNAPDSFHVAHHHHHHHHGHRHHTHVVSPRSSSHRAHALGDSSMVYDDDVSATSMASGYQDRPQRRRPGIPHSNICTICSTYIYIFRHRCLVCGRVYCRRCVSIGMGEMTEGRKCIPCLGRRFSARYIGRAGRVSCWWRYSSSVKQAELKWAEKGPERVGKKRGYKERSGVEMSRSRSPRAVMSPGSTNTTPSFVAASPYSPYSLNHHPHHLPL